MKQTFRLMLQTPGVNDQTLPVHDRRPVRRIRVPATATVLGQVPRVLHHVTALSTIHSLMTHSYHSQKLHQLQQQSRKQHSQTGEGHLPALEFCSLHSHTHGNDASDAAAAFQTSQTPSILTLLHIRKAKGIVFVIANYILHTVCPLLGNY